MEICAKKPPRGGLVEACSQQRKLQAVGDGRQGVGQGDVGRAVGGGLAEELGGQCLLFVGQEVPAFLAVNLALTCTPQRG